MAQSSEVTETDPVVYTQYNNLRKDVLDPTVGHSHSGEADGGKIISNVGWLYEYFGTIDEIRRK